MAITTKVCDSFLQDLLGMATHVSTDVFKLVLIKSGHTGTYNEEVTAVGTPGTGSPTTSNLGTDAVAASGDYNSVNGITLTGLAATIDTDTAILDFSDPAVLANTTISADGAIIYNSSKSNKAVAVFAFTGAPIVSTNGNFTITLPAPAASTALVRITS
jgi:hypothetical protein